jgi:hypothetical protein
MDMERLMQADAPRLAWTSPLSVAFGGRHGVSEGSAEFHHEQRFRARQER